MNRIYITVFLLGLMVILSSCRGNSKNSEKVVESEQISVFENKLVYETKMPSPSTEEPMPLLILMHGYGSNEQDMVSFSKALDPRAMILAVRAPHKIAKDKYSWYNLDRNRNGVKYSFDELKESRTEVMNLIRLMQQEHNIDEENILVGGFSQGAIMSLALSMKHSDVIDGAMVLSGDLYDEVEAEMEGMLIDRGLDVYMSHGRQDKVLPFAEAVKDIKFLKSRGVDVYEHYYDSAHTISRDNFVTLSHWLTAKIND